MKKMGLCSSGLYNLFYIGCLNFYHSMVQDSKWIKTEQGGLIETEVTDKVVVVTGGVILS